MIELVFDLARKEPAAAITSLLRPCSDVGFRAFCRQAKERVFALYPGKTTQAGAFSHGNASEEVCHDGIRRLPGAVWDIGY